MFKNLLLLSFLGIFTLCAFSSLEARTAFRTVEGSEIATNNDATKVSKTHSKKKIKRKKKSNFFSKIKRLFNKEPNEKWLKNRALILGSVSWFLSLLGLILAVAGTGSASAGAGLIILLGITVGIFAFVYGIGSAKRGIKGWKNTVGLIMGAIILGVIGALAISTVM